MSRREHLQQPVAEGKLTPYEARILLEALLRGESSQPLFTFIQEA
ncbi:hypothetical protein [Calidithermus timidus]|jgi:hypothetical protein|nr:hypothetical protein [Calidithermus timidus]